MGGHGIWGLSGSESEALWLSLKVASCAVAASLPLGIAAAMVFARLRFPGKSLVEGLVYLPLVLPPVVTGYALLVLLGRRGVVGAWLYDVFDITFAFRWTGAALASAVMGFPLMVRAIRLSLEAVDLKLEQAARTLGAGRWRIWATITLPLAAPGIIAGAILSFGRSLGEFGATITFVSNIPGETRTLPMAIYTYTQVPGGDPAALRLAGVSVGLSLVVLLASEWVTRYAARRVHGR